MLLIELQLGSETLILCPERTSKPTEPELLSESVGTCLREVMDWVHGHSTTLYAAHENKMQPKTTNATGALGGHENKVNPFDFKTSDFGLYLR